MIQSKLLVHFDPYLRVQPDWIKSGQILEKYKFEYVAHNKPAIQIKIEGEVSQEDLKELKRLGWNVNSILELWKLTDYE